jgi:2,4-dienoyl-CoA reductase-like NADH-dependent reductase (Old Yellow Enzyme family)
MFNARISRILFPMFPRIARFRSVAELREHLATLAAPIPLDDEPLSAAAGSPLARPLPLGGRTAGNRWVIHPMEGWDASPDGSPTEILLRRWRHFGTSGAKLIWGGEAVAVVPEGRANPNQLCAPACGREGFAQLLDAVRSAHRAAHGDDGDLIVALQLTHSGRFSRPTSAGLAPRIAYHHPILDARQKLDPADASCLVSDDDVERLIEAYLVAARDAAAAGFDMVDIKACHGYLVHEFLSARRRPGRFGGDFAGRTRLLTELVERVRVECPGLLVGIRLSLFDTVPWRMVEGRGEPWPFANSLPYDCGFGVDQADPLAIDLAELFEPIADEHGQRLECEVEACRVVAHRQILSQAIGNLLENAIKYSPSGTRLRLQVRRYGDNGAEVSVEDEGPGIPEHAREQALRPFVRLGDPVRRPGVGLGLAIAAAVARLHRGRLLLESANPGLRVRLQLKSG